METVRNSQDWDWNVGLAWGAKQKLGQDGLDACFADVSVGLQRVNVSNPGGIDLR